MAQIKIFGLKSSLAKNAEALSFAIHNAVMEALVYPLNKKFHRILPLDKEEFLYPDDRSENYTIIEISMFEGRSVEAKKQLITLIFENIDREVGIGPGDVEITIFETPKHDGESGGNPAMNYHWITKSMCNHASAISRLDAGGLCKSPTTPQGRVRQISRLVA